MTEVKYLGVLIDDGLTLRKPEQHVQARVRGVRIRLYLGTVCTKSKWTTDTLRLSGDTLGYRQRRQAQENLSLRALVDAPWYISTPETLWI